MNESFRIAGRAARPPYLVLQRPDTMHECAAVTTTVTEDASDNVSRLKIV